MNGENDFQSRAFLAGEGDAYFRRNPLDMDQQLADPWNRRLAHFLTDGKSVLEIGCSDGRRLAAMRQLGGTDKRFCGVDPSSEAVNAGIRNFADLELKVGTADSVGFDGPFDLVLFGFCLYLCDRARLFHAVAETDRLLKNDGHLAIIDFDPPFPQRRIYHHHEGLWSYKMDYSKLFLSSPTYRLIEKHVRPHHDETGEQAEPLPGDQVSLWILRKNEDDAYPIAT